MDLKNKKVLITGATGGIGNELVKTFLNYGAKILASGTNEEKLAKLRSDFKEIQTEKFKLDEHQNIENFLLNLTIFWLQAKQLRLFLPYPLKK